MPLALCAALAAAGCAGKGDGGTGVAGSVVIQPDTVALCVGDSLAFTAKVLDAAGDTIPGAVVRWSSSAPEAVAIDTASGVARALAFGATQITATAGGVRSANPARLDVPQDLVPEFVPDSAVLAPGDTMTLGVRFRRLSSGPVPGRTPGFPPFDSAVARLDATGLLTAKVPGLQGLSLSACGFTGHSAVRVYTPRDSATGLAYLWLSGPTTELRATLPAQVDNFTTSAQQPAFQVFSLVGPSTNPSRVFVDEYTAALSDTGTFRIDSLSSSEVNGAACAPPRPFATYYSASPVLALTSLSGGHTVVTSFAQVGSYARVSGRATLQMRGIVGNALGTLRAIYTFSAPLVTVTGVCP